METKLARIAQLSQENPKMVFTSIGHLINKEMLKDCHAKMDADKAVGIDGITKEEYDKHLDENLEKLVESLKQKSYKPRPARRVEIPKDNGKTRPLSIYCYEDKLVQEALRRNERQSTSLLGPCVTRKTSFKIHPKNLLSS